MIPYQMIKKNAVSFPGKKAFIDGEVSKTWEEYEVLVKKAIHYFGSTYDLNNINRAMILSDNRWELLIIYSMLSTFKIPYVGVDYSSSNKQKKHCYDSLKPELVIYGNKFEENVKDFDNATLFNIDQDFSEILKCSQTDPNLDDITSSSRVFESFAFTSGTSGYPKVVYRDVPFETRRMGYLTEHYGFCSDDVFLITVPFYHVSIGGWLRLFMNLGCTTVFSDFNNSADIYNKLKIYKITTTLMVPPVITKLLSYMENKDNHIYLKFVIVGGKNFPASIKKKAISLMGPVVHEYYGSTETGINILSDSNLMLLEPYSSGTTMDGSSVVIIDDDGNILPYGKVGRIAIHSYQNASSYIGQELNSISINEKKYIITADNGYFDEFGNLFVVCRSDLMQVPVDFNLYKFENLIRLIAGVDDVFICTRLIGDRAAIHLFLAAKKSITDDYGEDISALAKLLIASETSTYTQVKFVPKIPYSLSGKVKTKELEEL